MKYSHQKPISEDDVQAYRPVTFLKKLTLYVELYLAKFVHSNEKISHQFLGFPHNLVVIRV